MRRIILAVILLFAPAHAIADVFRIASFNASLSRKGPGQLLRDIERQHKQVMAVAEIIQIVRPDILLLNEFDHDADGRALAAFQALLAVGDTGIRYGHSFALAPNTGYPSGVDLDGDGKVNGPNDAFGFGNFPGQHGMAILSRFAIDGDAARSFALLRWVDFPDADLPVNADGTPFPNAAAQAAMRLSSKSHWDVPIETPGGRLHLWASHPTPPVFDGPEDRNGRRNSDEITFWLRYLDGAAFTDDAGRNGPRDRGATVILGDLNSDPRDGDSNKRAIRALLSHPLIIDPEPQSTGGRRASAEQGGVNAEHQTDPALDTADWRDKGGPGNLRVDYVLPTRDVQVVDAGVFWPAPDASLSRLIGQGRRPVSSDHRLVWVDIRLPAEK